MLTFENIPLLCADLGTPNAIPDIRGYAADNPAPAAVDEGMSPEEGAWVYQGCVHTMLPYTMQDGYGRDLKPSSLRMAVLENEYLRAEFAIDLGGRLWSLYSKTEKRELLFRNHVFQPANLALRNAWFSGGVEWNCGIIGHHAHTASPLFAARFVSRAGTETLKMWEYERKRGLVFVIRATLADDVLLVRVTVENPHDAPTYVYWRSNSRRTPAFSSRRRNTTPTSIGRTAGPCTKRPCRITAIGPRGTVTPTTISSASPKKDRNSKAPCAVTDTALSSSPRRT